MEPPAAVELMRERAARVHTISSRGEIVLSRPGGRTIHLDAAIVARPPDRLRIRAWKLSRAVFDLTLRPDGLWLLAPERRDDAQRPILDRLTADRVARAFSLLMGELPDERWRIAPGETPDVLHLRRGREGAAWHATCEVDRPTLTLRRCAVVDPEGDARLTVRLDRYRVFDGIIWPTRIRCEAPTGAITVLMDDLVFNEDLAPEAFDPPKRAGKLP